MTETEQPSSPVDITDKYNLPYLTPDFCRGLVGDIAGLAEEIERGKVNQLDFLQFCIAHLKKIDNFVSERTAGPTA